MNIEQIIFNIMKSDAHTWVRYWLSKEVSVTLPGEYVEIRSSYLSYISLKELFEAGFKIEKITPQSIGVDVYCDVLLKREL